MKIETKLMLTKLLLLMSSLGAGAVQAAEGQNYIMVVYSDSGHGEAVLEGNLDEAISSLQGRESRAGSFAEQVTLCVALTRTGQFDDAAKHCDIAVAKSEREARRLARSGGMGRYSERLIAKPKAVALTNRGVLHALNGEPAEARVLFELAREAHLTEEIARNNLARLELSVDESDS